MAIWRAIAARRAASARRRASANARRFRASTPRNAAARSRFVNGRRSLRSIALMADACSRATTARWRRRSRALKRPPRPRRAALADSRPPRRDPRCLAEAFLPFWARALRPAEDRFFPKAVPEIQSAKRINRMKTNRWGRRELNLGVIRASYLSFRDCSPGGELNRNTSPQVQKPKP